MRETFEYRYNTDPHEGLFVLALAVADGTELSATDTGWVAPAAPEVSLRFDAFQTGQ
jgi:hypothetical protein